MNMVGVSRTGSGKTLSFVLPALNHIAAQPQIARGEGPDALVMAPTRELAQQVESVARQYAQPMGLNVVSLVGGNDRKTQMHALRSRPAHFIVATPGRMIDLLNTRDVNLHRCTYLGIFRYSIVQFSDNS